MKTSVTFLILSILSIVVEVTCADLEDDLGDDGLPTEVDWRTKGVVTSVKDQYHGKNQHNHNCSSCWAFSTAGALEGQWKIATGNLYNLSVQQLVDCNKANHGCDGGWPARAFSYIINEGGINSEEQYPYTAMDGTCNITKRFVANMINYEFVTGYDETDLKRAVAEIGPISVTIFASTKFDDYSGGIFKCNKTASIRESNHAVLVVGYGRTQEFGHDYQDYWIVKNSYGTLWGEEGYMRMGTNYTENPCGIANHAFYPVVEKKCCQPKVTSYYSVDYTGIYNFLLDKNGSPITLNKKPVFEKTGNTDWIILYNGSWKIDKKQNFGNFGRMYIYEDSYCPTDLGEWLGWVNDVGVKEVGTVTCAST